MAKWLVLGALVLLAAGCGGGSKSSSPATTATTTQTTTTTPAATTSFTSSANCRKLARMAADVASSMTSGANGTLDPTHEAKVIDALANAAPKAVRADFQTFAQAYRNFADAYASSGLKPNKIPTGKQLAKLESVARELATPKVQRAVQHLVAWGRKNCGSSVKTTSTP